MPIRTPKHGLTLSYRKVKGRKVPQGWVKRIPRGEPVWVCSYRVADTPEKADKYFDEHASDLFTEAEPATATPIADPQDLPITTLSNVFLTRAKRRIGQQSRGISQGTYDEYEEVLNAFTGRRPDPEKSRTIGATAYRDLSPDDFGSFHAWLGTKFGVHRQKKYVVIVRSVFKLLGQPPYRLPPPDYGDQFHLPSKRDERREKKLRREKHGPKMFTAGEIHAQLHGRTHTMDEKLADIRRRLEGGRGVSQELPPKIDGAGVTMRAMILLGLNAGFGNTDVAELPMPVARAALKMEWIDYARWKTGADRLAWTWPETRLAIERYLAVRPVPAEKRFADLLFLNRNGRPYVTDDYDQISMRYGDLIDRLGQQQIGRNFYSLRRTYRSVAAEVGKELAIDLSMGHADELEDMARVYTVAELRAELKKISLHVRSHFKSALDDLLHVLQPRDTA